MEDADTDPIIYLDESFILIKAPATTPGSGSSTTGASTTGGESTTGEESTTAGETTTATEE
jgi:hypothetical protein